MTTIILEDQEWPLVWFGEPEAPKAWPQPGDARCYLCGSAPHTSECLVTRIREEEKS